MKSKNMCEATLKYFKVLCDNIAILHNNLTDVRRSLKASEDFQRCLKRFSEVCRCLYVCMHSYMVQVVDGC